MTAEKRYFAPDAKPEDLGLFILLNSRLTAALAAILGKNLDLLRTRFGVRIVVSSVTPDDLGEDCVCEWLAKDVVVRAIFAGERPCVLHDLANAAVRLACRGCIFIDAQDIVHSLPNVLKFIVSTVGLRREVSFSKDGRFLYCTTRSLRERGVYLTAGYMAQSLPELAAHLISAASTVQPALPRGTERDLALFATHRGIQRLKGYTGFRGNPLVFGGVLVADFPAIWMLANDDVEMAEATQAAANAPVFRPLRAVRAVPGRQASIVFDINPAASPSSGQTVPAHVSVPRQVLVACVVPKLPTQDAQPIRPAVFIASNYDKEAYIAASLYSVLAQTYPLVRAEVVDDLSTDASFQVASRFKEALDLPDSILRVRRNLTNRGTYWIRNDVIANASDSEAVFFVSDSDDYSVAQRAWIQVNLVLARPDTRGCFLDIVRVDSSYELLPLNREVERYGTASLCFKDELIHEAGYFQNLKKNADTEFLERVKTFIGDEAITRQRYPVLFQPFDGGNLTSDIYNLDPERRVLSQPNPARAAHSDAFRKHHKRLRKEQLTSHFAFPLSTITKEYQALTSDFLVPGYEAMDDCLLVLDGTSADSRTLTGKGYHVAQREREGWVITSAKTSPFASDQPLLSALAEYAGAGFFGYVVLPPAAGKLDLAKTSPRSLLEKILKQQVYESKRRGDNPWRDDGGQFTSDAELRSYLEQNVVLHSRALRNLEVDRA